MTPQDLINEYKKKNEELTVFEENKLGCIAVNCLSLAETWLQRETNTPPSMMLKHYDEDGAEIDCSYGVTKENLPLTILSICLRPHKTKNVKLLKYTANEGSIKSELLGELDIN